MEYPILTEEEIAETMAIVEHIGKEMIERFAPIEDPEVSEEEIQRQALKIMKELAASITATERAAFFSEPIQSRNLRD